MDGSIVQTYLSDVLHAVAQSLLAPDIILLLAFIGYALFCIGSVIAECFSERKHFKVTMPRFLADLMAAQEDEIPQVIEKSGLLNRQKVALLTVYDYRTLPGDALVALIRRLVSEEETRYDRITGRNNMAARITPMLGLMGTLIPLGPGVQALGNADTAALSSSLLVAFDTTVAGLVAAAVCLVVGKIRSNWYGNYMSALDSAMATMLQKIEDMRAEGMITVQEPTDYAFLFQAKKAAQAGRSAKGSKGAHSAKAGETAETVETAEIVDAGTAVGTADIGAAAEAVETAGADAVGLAAAGVGAQSVVESALAAQPFARDHAIAASLPTIDPDFTTKLRTQLASASSSENTGPLQPESASEPVSCVAPPVEEVPMPSFLDALEAVPTVDEANEPADGGKEFRQDAFGAGGWYQSQQRSNLSHDIPALDPSGQGDDGKQSW